MAFNADAYHMRKHREDRDKRMAEAREVKARAASGALRHPGEAEWIALHVRAARSANRLFVMYRRHRREQREWRGLEQRA